MLFSIIIVTRKRDELLRNCLNEVVLQMRGKSDVEILVGYNGEKVASHVQRDYQGVLFFFFENDFPGVVRNSLVKKSKGEWLLFLDDDVVIGKQYLTVLRCLIRKSEYSVFGGTEREYLKASYFEKLINYTLQSPFVTCNTRVRHCEIKEDLDAFEDKLTLSNLTIERKSFLRWGGFDCRFLRNEENVLLSKGKQREGRFLLSHRLFVHHKRRTSLTKFLNPSFWSGYYRMKMFFETEGLVDIRFFVPVTFFLYGLVVCFLSQMSFLFPVLFYIFCCLFYSGHLLVGKRKKNYILDLSLLQILTITSYSFGSLFYFFRSIFERIRVRVTA